MQVAVTHTTFKLYWHARLESLRHFLDERGANLTALEVAGKGSAYEFADHAQTSPKAAWWHCLFPNQRLEDLSPGHICRVLYERLDSIDPAVVLAGPIAFPPGVTAVRWACSRGRRVIVMDNVRPEDVPRPWIVDVVKRRIYRQVDAMLIPAPSHQRSFRFWGVPDDKMFFGLNVIDEAFYTQRAEQWRRQGRDAIVGEQRLPERFFLGVGRQVSKKNWDGLLRAYAAYCARQSDPWGLVLVGDGPERRRLEEIRRQRALRTVTFVPFQDSERLCAFYAAASALVLPSVRGETWGNVVNEAMACGLPVLVSRECGCAETMVRNGCNGWTFTGQSDDELAACLERMSLLPIEALKQMGAASRAIGKQWGLHRFAEGAWEAIQSVAGRPRVRRSPLDTLLLRLWQGRYRTT